MWTTIVIYSNKSEFCDRPTTKLFQFETQALAEDLVYRMLEKLLKKDLEQHNEDIKDMREETEALELLLHDTYYKQSIASAQALETQLKECRTLPIQEVITQVIDFRYPDIANIEIKEIK